jgi:hypothetical protein
MKRTLRFYKDSADRWYADIPEWTGSIDDLQMVMGADNLLDIMSEGDGEVKVHFSTDPFEGSNVMTWCKDGVLGDPSHGGGTYRLHQYKGIVYDLDLWLCDVTKFVFGNMPSLIFFVKTTI